MIAWYFTSPLLDIYQKKSLFAWCDRVGVGIGRIVGWMGISEGSGVIRGDSKNRNEKKKKRVVGSSQGAPLALSLTLTLVRLHFSFPALWALSFYILQVPHLYSLFFLSLHQIIINKI